MPSTRITPEQERAIVALISEPTLAKAAKAAKVHEATLLRWLKLKGFGRAYRSARRDAFAQAVAMTQRYAPIAVQALAKAMTDAEVPHSTRVSAAIGLLRFARESAEIENLHHQLEELEALPLASSDVDPDPHDDPDT